MKIYILEQMVMIKKVTNLENLDNTGWILIENV
jgi:hypothetical protein